MCGSMVDIPSPAAEIRRGKKKKIDRRKKLQGKNIMAPLLHRAPGGHNNILTWREAIQFWCRCADWLRQIVVANAKLSHLGLSGRVSLDRRPSRVFSPGRKICDFWLHGGDILRRWCLCNLAWKSEPGPFCRNKPRLNRFRCVVICDDTKCIFYEIWDSRNFQRQWTTWWHCDVLN